MVLYGITLFNLKEEICKAGIWILVPLYVEDVEFDGGLRWSIRLMCLQLEQEL